jgi:hypothetical protein
MYLKRKAITRALEILEVLNIVKLTPYFVKQAPGPQYAAAGAQFPGAGYYGGAQPQPAAAYPGYPGYTG